MLPRQQFCSITILALPLGANGSLCDGMQEQHNIALILPFTYIGSGGSYDEKMSIKSSGRLLQYP